MGQRTTHRVVWHVKKARSCDLIMQLTVNYEELIGSKDIAHDQACPGIYARIFF